MAENDRTIREILKEEVAGGVRQGFSTTSGLMSSAFQETANDLKTIFGGLQKSLVGTFQLLTSPMGSLRDIIKGTTVDDNGMGKEVVEFKRHKELKGELKGINIKLGKSTDIEKKSVDQQEDIIEKLSWFEKYFRKSRKREAATFEKKSLLKQIMDYVVLFFGALFVGVGAIIGSLTRKITLPFEFVIKSFTGLAKLVKESKVFSFVTAGLTKLGNLFTKIGDFVTRGKISSTLSKFFGIFTKIGETIKQSKIFGLVSKSFGIIKGIFSKVMEFGKIFKNLPIFGKIAKGFMVGLRKLFIPLQIIMSAIDFIQGFSKAKGGIVEKIKGGLEKVVQDFLDLPIKLFGWISDWFLGLFGVKFEGGVASKIKEGISWAFDTLFGSINLIWNIIKSVSENFIKFTKKLNIFEFIGNQIKSIGEIVTSIFGIFNNIIKSLWSLANGDIPAFWKSVKNLGQSIKNLIKSVINYIFTEPIKLLSNIGNLIINWFKEKFIWFKDMIFNLDFGKAMESIGDFKTKILNGLKEKLKNILTGIKDWILDKIPGVKALFGGIKLSEEMKKKVEKERNKNISDESIKASNKLVKELSEKKIIEKNWIGKSEIKDWFKIEKMKPQQIQKIINYGDWDDETLSKLISIKEKKSKETFKSNTSTSNVLRGMDKSAAESRSVKEKRKEQKDAQEKEENKKIQKETQRVSKEQTKELKNMSNKVNILNQNVNTNNQGSKEEIPDEIENLSILFLNKSNIGVGI